MNSEKVLAVKFGWSEFYRGGPVFNNNRGVGEKFNFLPTSDGSYYCYVPVEAELGKKLDAAERTGWTVVCLAKQPKVKGIHLVGWYENAALLAPAVNHPDGEDLGAYWLYSIRAPKAYLVPPDQRNSPFSNPSIGRSSFYRLSGPGAQPTRGLKKARATVLKQVKALKDGRVAVLNPHEGKPPDHENNETDPLRGHGTPEHRKKVEQAAVQVAQRELKRLGYSCKSVESQNCGYDLLATRRREPAELHVEVKGTSSSVQQFFLTPNEFKYQKAKGHRAKWRLALVMNALTQPVYEIFDHKQFKQAFRCEPGVYVARSR